MNWNSHINLPSLLGVYSVSISPSTLVSLWSKEHNIIIPQYTPQPPHVMWTTLFHCTRHPVLVSCISHKLVPALRSEWGRCFLAQWWCPSPGHWSEAAGSRRRHHEPLLSGSGQNTRPDCKVASCSRHYTPTHWRQRERGVNKETKKN